jgi:PTH1 family peptidyl-tRNA hydrolase
MSPILFVGLGNPGQTYEKTRHNAGWLAIDELIKEWENPAVPTQWKGEKKLFGSLAKIRHLNHDCFFLKPNTFMNESGLCVASAVKWFLDEDPTQPDQDFRQVVILHDDLDLPLGKYKLQYQSGPKVHNGVNSVRQHLHSDKFWVARIGIDTREGDRTIPGQAYVLQPFTQAELSTLRSSMKTLGEELAYTVLE